MYNIAIDINKTLINEHFAGFLFLNKATLMYM